jgi:hypothetical protein
MSTRGKWEERGGARLMNVCFGEVFKWSVIILLILEINEELGLGEVIELCLIMCGFYRINPI